MKVNGNGTVVNSNIYLQAGTTIHANSGKDGEITGDFSGNHALTKQGSGKLTLSGKVDISTLNAHSGEILSCPTQGMPVTPSACWMRPSAAVRAARRRQQ